VTSSSSNLVIVSRKSRFSLAEVSFQSRGISFPWKRHISKHNDPTARNLPSSIITKPTFEQLDKNNHSLIQKKNLKKKWSCIEQININLLLKNIIFHLSFSHRRRFLEKKITQLNAFKLMPKILSLYPGLSQSIKGSVFLHSPTFFLHHHHPFAH